MSNSNSHSAWLTFMYPRLYVAKELLKDDGVIFVSIDDNEVAQLRLLMDEVFGEENFVAEFVWEKIHSVKNDAKYVSDNHEYVLCWSKNKTAVTINLMNRTAKMDAAYRRRNFLSVKVFKLDLEGDFKLLFFGGLLCS